jgi:hypothetical protein
VLHAGTVERVARGEVVGAVEDDVHAREQWLEILRFDSLLQRNNLHARIEGRQRGLRRLDLWRAYAVGAVEDLPLQVGEVDLVRIGEGELADAAGGEIERRGTAEAAGADDEGMRIAQPLLALDPDFREQDVAAVAEELLVVQIAKPGGKTAGGISSPWWSAWRRA